MSILVTGCAGFIGYHLCEKLLKNKKKTKIFGIDNLNDYYDLNLKKSRLYNLLKKRNFSFEKIDIKNKTKLINYFKINKIEIVVHLAAQAGVRYSIKHPESYLR